VSSSIHSSRPRLSLGLAICHQILEQHRGAIDIQSEEGRGTMVTCLLQVAKS
jgi:signal transduction histidine kinase